MREHGYVYRFFRRTVDGVDTTELSKHFSQFLQNGKKMGWPWALKSRDENGSHSSPEMDLYLLHSHSSHFLDVTSVRV